MRYRRLDANGDMCFGHGQGDFWRDSPEAPAQAVLTRLRLEQGEWFLDRSDGTPWLTQVLGRGTVQTRDPVIRERVLDTAHVSSIDAYASQTDLDRRNWAAQMVITTDYGGAALSMLPFPSGAFGAPAGWRALPPSEVPPTRPPASTIADFIGIEGTTETQVSAVPAQLRVSGGLVNISDFRIERLDAGRL